MAKTLGTYPVPIGSVTRVTAHRKSLFFVAAYAGALLLWMLFNRESAETRNAVGDIGGTATALLATLWSLKGIKRPELRLGKPSWATRRRGWAANMLTLSLASYSTGMAIWTYLELVLHQQPYPSWADSAFVSGMVSLVSGALLLPSRPVAMAYRMRVLLDSLMTMAALVTFSWYFFLGPALLASGVTLLGKTLSASYPLLELAFIFCVLTITAHPREKRLNAAPNLLALGVLCYVLADIGYSYLSLKGTYATGLPTDTGYFAGNLLIALATCHLRSLAASAPAEDESETMAAHQNPILWRALLPYALVPAVAALLVYVWRNHQSGALASGVYVGGGVLVGLILIRQVFAIVENSRLYRFLQESHREQAARATTDSMTGLANHRAFQERLRTEIGMAEKAGTPLSLLLIDVDRFKQYNDSFGHPAGDQALRILGALLKSGVRPGDLPARYGGEEFAVVLPGIDSAEAWTMAERLRNLAMAEEFPHRQVTLSIGVACCAEQEYSPESLIERADGALYVAKKGGRNRAVVAGDATALSLVEGGESGSEPGIDPLVRTLLAVLELRDVETEHCERVASYCLRLAEEATKAGVVQISPAEMRDLYLGALLHDIGKVGVPDAILFKAGTLTESEWKTIQCHSELGADLLARHPSLAAPRPIVRSHHERWDGAGYPDRLSGTDIPIGARLFALADTLDAMWSTRPYRGPATYAAIREEIIAGAGGQFDPKLAEVFLSVPQAEWERLRAACADAMPLAHAA